MSQLHYITSSHKKGKHLSFEERVVIQLRIKDGYSIRAIAREIGCSPTTVSNMFLFFLLYSAGTDLLEDSMAWAL